MEISPDLSMRTEFLDRTSCLKTVELEVITRRDMYKELESDKE